MAQNPRNHRRVFIDPFAGPDPDWAGLQSTASPLPSAIPDTDLTAPIIVSGGDKIFWWAVARNGAGPGAATVDGSAITFDAVLTLVTPVIDATDHEFVRWTSVLEGLGALGTNGLGIVEFDVPFACSCYIRMISVVGGGAPATHLWINYVATENRVN